MAFDKSDVERQKREAEIFGTNTYNHAPSQASDMGKLFIVAVIVGALALLLYMSTTVSEPEVVEDPIKRTPEEMAALNAEWAKEKDEKIELGKALYEATDAKLIGLLQTCRASIENHVRSNESGGFASHLVTEYSPDSYQAAAFASGMGKLTDTLKSDRKRIEFYRRAIDLEGGDEYSFSLFNTTYVVITPYDSFGGVKNLVSRYKCSVGVGLEISEVVTTY